MSDDGRVDALVGYQARALESMIALTELVSRVGSQVEQLAAVVEQLIGGGRRAEVAAALEGVDAGGVGAAASRRVVPPRSSRRQGI